MGASCSGSLALTCFILFLLFKRCILFSVVCLVVSHCVGPCACDCRSLQRPGEGQDPLGLESQALLSCPTRALTAQFQSPAGAARLLTTSTSFTLKEKTSLPLQWSFPGAGEEGSRTRTPTHTGTCRGPPHKGPVISKLDCIFRSPVPVTHQVHLILGSSITLQHG